MNDSERDELLVRLDERIKSIHEKMTDHLKKHWAFTVMGISGVVSFVFGLVMLLFKK